MEVGKNHVCLIEKQQHKGSQLLLSSQTSVSELCSLASLHKQTPSVQFESRVTQSGVTEQIPS